MTKTNRRLDRVEREAGIGPTGHPSGSPVDGMAPDQRDRFEKLATTIVTLISEEHGLPLEESYRRFITGQDATDLLDLMTFDEELALMAVSDPASGYDRQPIVRAILDAETPDDLRRIRNEDAAMEAAAAEKIAALRHAVGLP